MTNEVDFDFDGTEVLVTGGTSGIGHAIALAFRDAGARVTVTGTRAAATDYDTDLAGLDLRRLDVRSPESVDGLASGIGRLDVLVNNAGASFPDGRDEWDPDAFTAALALNLGGAMRLSTRLRDVLSTSPMAGGASVVNLASMAAFRAVTLVPGYGAAKAGLVQLTRTMAVQWQPLGIRVNAVAPGLIDTPMTAPMAGIPGMLADELHHIPMGRMGRADEVTPAVMFLCSRGAAYLTGSVVAVDGGYLAH